MMIMFMLLMLFILVMLMLVSWFISNKKESDREKLTPFECGFDPLMLQHMSFCINYYIFSLIFLVFDVEIILLFPYILVMKSLSLTYLSMLVYMSFLLILMIGLFLEYLDNSLEWSY